MSVAGRLGLPEAVQTMLLVVVVVLALAAWFPGVTLGSMQIPKLDFRRRRALRKIGPIAVVLGIALVVPLAALRPPPVVLSIAAADVTENGDIDIAIANSGTSAAVLTGLELEVLRECAVTARPVLTTAATYRIPIGDLVSGGRRRIVIRHLVPAGATERIVIAPESSHAARVALSVYASGHPALRTVLDLALSNDRADHR